MTDQMLAEPVELTDAELDAVSGGQPILPNVAVGNLVDVQANVNDVLSHNDVAAAVAAVVLGKGAFAQVPVS